MDILDVEKHLDGLIDRYRDQLLNDLPEFAGLNPSLEHFARILAEGMDAQLANPGVSMIKVVLWEDDSAWAAYVVRA